MVVFLFIFGCQNEEEGRNLEAFHIFINFYATGVTVDETVRHLAGSCC